MPEVYSVFIKRSMIWIWKNFFVILRNRSIFVERYLKEKKIPPQVVCNKLNIQTVSCELKNLNRLDRVLISKRLLFKKITIMPKGCFPMFEGVISNIPVKTNDTVNVLPHGATAMVSYL